MLEPVFLRQNDLNRYKAQWEFRNGLADVQTTPPNLQLARTNICNFNCVYCADHRPGSLVPKIVLEDWAWERLENLIPNSSQLSFHGISEFMADKNFFGIVEKCSVEKINLLINTNGSVCTDAHRKILANYGGYLVFFVSVDAASPETYLRIRGKDFNKTVANIRRFVESLAPRGQRVWMCLSFVIMKSNYHEVVDFVRLAKSLGVNGVKFYTLHEYPDMYWKAQLKDGSVFDYADEVTNKFPTEFNRVLRDAWLEADRLGVHIELPGFYEEGETARAEL